MIAVRGWIRRQVRQPGRRLGPRITLIGAILAGRVPLTNPQRLHGPNIAKSNPASKFATRSSQLVPENQLIRFDLAWRELGGA
eukprot:310258-Rhodomonas_salina.5